MTRLDDLLVQYGLHNGAPGAAPAAEVLNPFAASAPGAQAADPTMGSDPAQNIRDAVAYAKTLGKQAQGSIQRGARTLARAPGLAGAVGASAEVMSTPSPQPPVPDAATLTALIGQHESGNDYTALNKQGSSASGKYQYTDGTWGGYGGYARAALAPRAIQDQRAREDVAKSLARYDGDPFKVIAAHYLPAAASNPATWAQPYKLPSGKTVAPVADYVRQTVANTPLQEQLDAYLQQYNG